MSLAVVFLVVLGGIAFALWSVALAIAGIASTPFTVVLSNGAVHALKLEVELGTHILPLKIELDNHIVPLKVELHPLKVQLSNEPRNPLNVQLEPVVVSEGKVQVELENGIRPLEVKTAGSGD